MNYVIVSGSHRDDSQSFKVSNWLSDVLQNQDSSSNVDIINLAGNPVPLWQEDAWNPDSELSKKMEPYLKKVEQADALILVAAEWAGMVPAALKNFLLYISSAQAAHKPCLLVGVSAGRGGTYPIAELRLSGYKNNRIVYIPDHLIVQDVQNVMNDLDFEQGSDADQYIKKRAGYSLEVLRAYTEAFKKMREGHELLRKEYPFGM